MKFFVTDPFKEFDKLFFDLSGSSDVEKPTFSGGCFVPKSDIIEHDEMAQLVVELPGVRMEDVAVNVEDGVMTISGERKPLHDKGYRRRESCTGKFERRFSLPDTIDTDKIGAEFKMGLLTVSLPKKPKAQPKKIDVSVS